MTARKGAIFLDRDGVINHEKNYVHKIEDFTFIDGIFQAVRCFRMLDYLVIIITNQSGIGRGYYTEDDFSKLNNWMLHIFDQEKAFVDKVYFCPHRPNEDCFCRKPKPGMILKAAHDFNIDLNRSWIIGDKKNDLQAGKKAGISNLILVRSGHKIDEANTIDSFIVDSAFDTIEVICSHHKEVSKKV